MGKVLKFPRKKRFRSIPLNHYPKYYSGLLKWVILLILITLSYFIL